MYAYILNCALSSPLHFASKKITEENSFKLACMTIFFITEFNSDENTPYLHQYIIG